MAAAYTVFANGGLRVSPVLIDSVRNATGDVILDFKPEKRQVLDPRVVAVMTNMMEGVMNFGYGFVVRQRGFMAPAAGKTGTSHDGWFAGYTSNLLCIVWVGFDDYSDLHLSGAQTAAPIWAEFMKKAITLPQYSDVKPFFQPPGVVEVQLDKGSNLLATSSCPETYTAVFIAGTEPNQTCDQPTGVKGFFTRILGLGGDKALPPQSPQSGPLPPGQPAAQAGATPANGQAEGEGKKKKSFLGKIAGIFQDDKPSNPPPKLPDAKAPPPQ
jgi:penicillin-binding protein 1B